MVSSDMRIKSLTKTIVTVCGVCGSILIRPQTAHANEINWDVGTTANDIGLTQQAARTVSPTVITNIAWNVGTLLFGIAVSLFVLKVVMTAINKGIFGEAGNGNDKAHTRKGSTGSISSMYKRDSVDDSPFDLTELPGVIAAYPADTPWREIWKKFAVSVAIATGIWVLMGVVIGVINWVIGALELF